MNLNSNCRMVQARAYGFSSNTENGNLQKSNAEYGRQRTGVK